MARLTVEVVHALPGRQQVVILELEPGATVRDAVRASGMTARHAGVAVFGEKVGPLRRLRDGDRVELLRPLRLPPGEARRRRAQRSRLR